MAAFLFYANYETVISYFCYQLLVHCWASVASHSCTVETLFGRGNSASIKVQLCSKR
jgi:hypothetical protein